MLPFSWDSINLRMLGRIITKASTTTRAGFRLPHGAAPTSPVNGDLWTTNAGTLPISVRINGTTHNIYTDQMLISAGAAQVQGFSNSDYLFNPNNFASAMAYQTLTDGASISWNMNGGFNAKVTIAGNRTLNTPTNPREGMTYVLQVIQDATGSRTMTWPASTVFDWGSAGSPTLSTTAGKIDVVTLQCINASTPLFRASFNKAS